MFVALSCALFFGFVSICIFKFGLLSCYSAYGPYWINVSGTIQLNWWSAITFITAALLIPVLLENSDGNPWQFAGFFCPALLMFVALTPEYGTNKLAGSVHSLSAGLSALFSVIYIICVTPQLWWILAVIYGISTVCTLISGKYYWCFWFEMGAYASIYVAVFLII